MYEGKFDVFDCCVVLTFLFNLCLSLACPRLTCLILLPRVVLVPHRLYENQNPSFSASKSGSLKEKEFLKSARSARKLFDDRRTLGSV
jgi:hypothetical protein